MGDLKSGESQHLILVSGLSGSGKSTALGALEDLGYYCADNLPAALLADFADHIQSEPAAYSKVALGIDARSRGSDLAGIPDWVNSLSESGIHCQLLFFKASTAVLIQRFSETRRRHPLTTNDHALPAAIDEEQELLGPIQTCADWVMDTSQTNIHQLRHQVWKWAGEYGNGMTLVLESFAFRLGVPQDVDFVFDARCLPNPHWVDELKKQTGLDPVVGEWLEQDPMVGEMYAHISKFMDTWLPRFQAAQRSYLTVGIGCTGGRHRSVYLVKKLSEELKSRFPHVVVHHRDLPA